MAAEFATPEKIAFFLQHTSGVICATSLTSERARQLDLAPMVQHNTETQRTAFLVTVDYRHGTTTGISAADRAATIRASSTTPPSPTTCCGRDTSSRWRHATAACSSGPGTPRRRSTWRDGRLRARRRAVRDRQRGQARDGRRPELEEFCRTTTC